MPKLLRLLTTIISIPIALSTTFAPVSIKVQIKEAESIVYGQVLAFNSEQTEDSMIATQYMIKLDKWVGMDPNKERIISVYTPGGEVGGKTLEVSGTAKMNIGEKVILFLGKDEKQRYWVKNLGMGKYSAKKVGNATLMVNQVFPFHPEIGQIKLGYFLGLVERVKEEKFQERFKDKYEIQALKQVNKRRIKKRGRNIASIMDEQDQASKSSTFWLVLILGVLGGAVSFARGRYFNK